MATIQLNEKMVTTVIYNDDMFTGCRYIVLFNCSFDEAYCLIEKNGGKIIKVIDEKVYEITCRNEYHHASYYRRSLHYIAPVTCPLSREIIVKTFT